MCITCFILEFAWPGVWLTRRNLILLGIVPLLNAVLILSDVFYPLAEACQDRYLDIMIWKAVESGQPVRTEPQVWSS